MKMGGDLVPRNGEACAVRAENRGGGDVSYTHLDVYKRQVWQRMLPGMLIGVVGIVLLVCLIPLLKGVKGGQPC